MSMPSGLEGLMIVRALKEGDREGVPVPISHGDKRGSERSGSAFGSRESRATCRSDFKGEIIDFTSKEHIYCNFASL